MMHKSSAIITPLQPHQQRAVDKAMKNGLILAHSLGSGKTLSAIAAADRLGKPTTVLTPASLVENFKKELKKHKKGGPPVEVLSMPTAVKQHYKIPEGNTLILDEAHSYRNAGTAKQKYIKEMLSRVGRVIALTGTPAYNEVENWAPLVNIVAKDSVFPEDPKAFDNLYIKENEVDPGWYARLKGIKPGIVKSFKNKDLFKYSISPYVDVYEGSAEVPETEEQIIKVPMSKEQQDYYRLMEGNIPMALRWKLRYSLPPSKSEAASMNAFYTGVRQVSNTPEAYSVEPLDTGEKIHRAVKELQNQMKNNPRFKALVYSNFLGSGVDSYAKQLDKLHIPYNKFTGSLTSKQKKQIVDDYNSGKVPVILGSGSASEGLDLKGTRLVQLLEPHFNNAKLDQVIGRAVRYKSHSDLPPEERKVLIQRYLSMLPDDEEFFGLHKVKHTGVDEYITDRANEKQKLIDDIRQTIRG